QGEKAFLDAHAIHSRVGNINGAASALCGLGETYRSQTRCDEAEKAYLDSHAIHSRTGDDIGAANALNGLANVYLFQSRASEAKKVFMEAHAIHSRVGHNVGIANALNGLAKVYRLQSRTCEAEKAFLNAHTIHSRTGNDIGNAKALTGLANIYLLQSRTNEAENAFLHAHAIHSRLGNSECAADALHGLGETYGSQSRCNEAEKAFQDSHAIYSRSGGEIGAANALNGLAKVYRSQSRNREAEKAARDAHAIYSRNGDDVGTANALKNLADTYLSQSRNREAEKALLDAHAIYSRTGNDTGLANVSFSLAKIYRSQSRNVQAEEALLKAYGVYTSNGNFRRVGETLYCLGNLLSQQGRNHDAASVCSEAIDIYENIGSAHEKAKLLLFLGHVHLGQRRFVDAENAVNEALAIYVSLGDEGNQRFASLQLSFIASYQPSTGCKNDSRVGTLLQAAEMLAQKGVVVNDPNWLGSLGQMYAQKARYWEAEENYCLAQAICMSSGDAKGEAKALRSLGDLYFGQNQCELAEEHFGRARAAYALASDDDGEAKALDGLMLALIVQLKLDDLRAFCTDARKLYDRMGKPMSRLCAKMCEMLPESEGLPDPQSHQGREVKIGILPIGWSLDGKDQTPLTLAETPLSAASKAVFGFADQTLPKLELQDVNFVHTSDIHSWYRGHHKADDVSGYWDANIGDVASFVFHMKNKAEQRGQDLFFINSGDDTHGGGLSDASDPEGGKACPFDAFVNRSVYLNLFFLLIHQALAIHASLPYDVMTPGNHELETRSIARNLYYNVTSKLTGVDEYKFLASNVFFKDDLDEEVRIAEPYRIWTTRNGKGRKVAALGVSFEDDKTAAAGVRTQPIADMVKEDWFVHDVLESDPDLFLLVGHMSLSDKGDKWDVLRAAIRKKHPTTPIFMFGGHTHNCDCRMDFDPVGHARSIALESGRYLETVGWVSATLTEPSKPLKFVRRYLDPSRETFMRHSGADKMSFDTEVGKEVMRKFDELAVRMGLDEFYG
ncbi:hypothetical protein FRB90_003926, partial [Tulasnella sp. 427]